MVARASPVDLTRWAIRTIRSGAWLFDEAWPLLQTVCEASPDDRVRATKFKGLFRIQGCVDASIYDPGSAFTRDAPDLHASQSIAGMDADAHYIARLDAIGLNLCKGFVGDQGVPVLGRGRSGKHIQPSRRDHADSERRITGIDQVYAHH